MIQEELQAIADLTVEYFKIEKVKVELKLVNGGRARIKTRKITIPIFAVDNGEAYYTYYVVHEVAHFLSRTHNDWFKKLETEGLRQWGIKPKYARAYAKELLSLNGETLYKRKEVK